MKTRMVMTPNVMNKLMKIYWYNDKTVRQTK